MILAKCAGVCFAVFKAESVKFSAFSFQPRRFAVQLKACPEEHTHEPTRINDWPMAGSAMTAMQTTE